MKKYVKIAVTIIILLPIIYFLINWGSALIRCEVLTIMHGSEFGEIYKEKTMIGELDYLKVLNYSDEYAEVYYVSKHRAGGNIVSFVKENNIWQFKNWKTVWSNTGGSASDVIWPYWWHFIYGGF